MPSYEDLSKFAEAMEKIELVKKKRQLKVSMTPYALLSECDVPSDDQLPLAPGERPVAAYETSGDVAAVVTDRRLLVPCKARKGGLTVGAVTWSVPWGSVVMWSSWSFGRDGGAGLELRTRAGRLTLALSECIDVRRLDGIIARYVL